MNPETRSNVILRFQVLKCPECGAVLNAAASPEHPALPSPGDYCVCGTCGAVMMFGDDRRPRGMTEAEMEALIADTETMDAIALSVARVRLIRAKPETEKIQ